MILDAGSDWQKFEDNCVNDNLVIEERTFVYAEKVIAEQGGRI